MVLDVSNMVRGTIAFLRKAKYTVKLGLQLPGARKREAGKEGIFVWFA